MLWWINEEETELTQWRCSSCGFYTREDEADSTTNPIDPAFQLPKGP